jgi:type II secretory pathway pseudopilin PulG
MKKGITIIEILVIIVLLVGVVFAIIPHLVRGCASANVTAARTGCQTVIAETQTFLTSKGHLPENTADLFARIDLSIYNAIYDQNQNDALIATDGTGATVLRKDGIGASVRRQSTYKNYTFIFLVKTDDAPDGSVDPLVRGVMALPIQYNSEDQKDCYYRTNETGTTWTWVKPWELATNSPKSSADAIGMPMYFKPAGPKSKTTSLVYEDNLLKEYFKSGN